MTLVQLCRAVPSIAAIERANGRLPSLRRFSAAEYTSRLELDQLLACLEVEIRLLACGHELGARDGNTFRDRVAAAQLVVSMLDTDAEVK